MAAGGFREFVAGEILTEDLINDYLLQGMLVFAGTAARGSAIPSPVEGQFSFRTDDDVVEFYDGSQWTELSTGIAWGSATGGSVVTQGKSRYNVFSANGNLVVVEPGFFEYAIVAGGGGGASGGGGGGGAGGVLTGFVELAAGTVAVTVGAGGAGGVGSDVSGAAGANSVVASLGTAIGGGFGGGPALNGGTGGSGGGGGRSGGLGGSGTSGQGFAGGNGSSPDNATGGGGGGFRSVGTNGNATTSGSGGDGDLILFPVGAGGSGSGWTGGGFSTLGSGGRLRPTNFVLGGMGMPIGDPTLRASVGPLNSGSGGGAGARLVSTNYDGVAGGSGIVVFRVGVE
jgi:hypothetical protein